MIYDFKSDKHRSIRSNKLWNKLLIECNVKPIIYEDKTFAIKSRINWEFYERIKESDDTDIRYQKLWNDIAVYRMANTSVKETVWRAQSEKTNQPFEKLLFDYKEGFDQLFRYNDADYVFACPQKCTFNSKLLQISFNENGNDLKFELRVSNILCKKFPIVIIIVIIINDNTVISLLLKICNP